MNKTNTKQDVFTILYEINGQQYLIGVTNGHVPTVASIGVNTPRPLPQNIKSILTEKIMQIRKMDKKPQVIDYNAASTNISKTLLGDFSMSPKAQYENHTLPIKTIEEALAMLKTKMGDNCGR